MVLVEALAFGMMKLTLVQSWLSLVVCSQVVVVVGEEGEGVVHHQVEAEGVGHHWLKWEVVGHHQVEGEVVEHLQQVAVVEAVVVVVNYQWQGVGVRNHQWFLALVLVLMRQQELA